MKVLHLLQSNRFSGAENVVCQIINMLKTEKDIEMFYCSRDGEIRDSLKVRKIKFIPISKLSVSEVKRVIKELKPDIIHAHDMKASFVASLACGSIPLISHIHGNHFNARSISIKSLLFILAGTKSKRILWVSKSSYEGYVFKKLFKRKSDILYNIIDIDSLYRRAEMAEIQRTYDVVYIGRLSYPKNPQRLMDVLKGLISKNSAVKVAIVGSGELEEETHELCKKYMLGDNVEFLGFVENPLNILKKANVMIMTSRYEGTPMVALEAMAFGIPIVSTPTDGMNELITNDINGYLADADEQLIYYLDSVLKDNDLRSVLSNNQLRKSKDINDIEKYKNHILNIYQRNVQ